MPSKKGPAVTAPNGAKPRGCPPGGWPKKVDGRGAHLRKDPALKKSDDDEWSIRHLGKGTRGLRK